MVWMLVVVAVVRVVISDGVCEFFYNCVDFNFNVMILVYVELICKWWLELWPNMVFRGCDYGSGVLNLLIFV